MTLNEMISEFRVIIELDSSGLPGLKDEEIILFIDNAQNAIVNQRLQGHTIDKTKYPETQKRIDDLNKLYKIDTISGAEISDSAIVNYYDFNLSSITDYMHIDEVVLDVNVYNYHYGRFKMKPIPRHLTYKYEYSPNNKPYIEDPAYILINNGSEEIIRTYFDLYEATKDPSYNWNISLEVGYIKTPSNIKDLFDVPGTSSVDDFSYSVYKEIIRKAVDEAISIISPKMAQVSQQQLNKSE